MKNYAHIEDGKVINVTVCDDPEYAKQRKWVDIHTTNPMPGIGWTTPDAGKTFEAPPPPPAPAASETVPEPAAPTVEPSGSAEASNSVVT